MNPLILLLILIIAYIAVSYIISYEIEPPKNIENIASVNYNDDDYANVSYYYDPRSYDVGFLSRAGLLPWWNSTRFTRNMSYDVRGDIPVPVYYVGPWLNSPFL